jgi:hypothetical protein
MKKFNTHLKDRHFQEIHHALGCPWPEQVLGETYRNYFATGDDSETAQRMKASPHWSCGRKVFDYISFSVTEEGRKALLKHMQEALYVPARYTVRFHDLEGEMVVPAKSHSAARYEAYQRCDLDEPFGHFLKQIRSVRLKSKALNPELAA